ncbi:unnamed protein product [Candidula unifasciata]|uniref:VOC domain-containing protein n=1 Tax=Candidula unifasciata TaxID=100452 RepID=A0A8S3YQ53_9EUPU|nr:unnamed protein product [Candidula unifasciata]
MTSFPCVHHIEIGAVNGPQVVETLTSQFTFRVKARRQTELADQWLLLKENSRILVTSLKTPDLMLIKNDNFVINWATSSDQPSNTPTLPVKDSVFNVAFEVRNIDFCIKRLNQQAITFTKPLHTIHDSDGFIRTCTVKSCVGDIHHTLIERNGYSGVFLPGFTSVSDNESRNKSETDPMLEYFDHVALAVDMGTSMAVIGWYEKCFGMKRFLINSEEDKDKGLVLSTNDVGLRLRAMEYWKCSEVGLLAPEEEGAENRLSLVVAEGLSPVPGCQEENQITSWLRQHGGPGIQHLAFTSSDIKQAVRNLAKLGVPFAKPPPPAYYTKEGRLDDIKGVGENVDDLRTNGILIDTEAERLHESDCDKSIQMTYLLQIFTKPLLPSDPFFLEIIQRKGATGFGSGNIAALYRSIQAYIVGENNSKQNM